MWKQRLKKNEHFSKWRSGTPTDWCRGMIFFDWFVNDLEGVHSEFSKFTDDTTYFWVVRCHVLGMLCMKTVWDCISRQKSHRRNSLWANIRWMHLGKNDVFPSSWVKSRKNTGSKLNSMRYVHLENFHEFLIAVCTRRTILWRLRMVREG